MANQKQYVAVYLMGVYGDEAERRWFVDAWKATGRKLDMGKSCVRFKKLDDVALDVLGEAVARVPPEQIMAIHDRAHGNGVPGRDGMAGAGGGIRGVGGGGQRKTGGRGQRGEGRGPKKWWRRGGAGGEATERGGRPRSWPSLL